MRDDRQRQLSYIGHSIAILDDMAPGSRIRLGKAAELSGYTPSGLLARRAAGKAPALHEDSKGLWCSPAALAKFLRAFHAEILARGGAES